MAEAVLPVLKGINLELGRGQVAAVTGVSGVGKSTLLHILGGLDHPTSGEVAINSTTLSAQSEQALARFRCRHVGFVFQFHYLLDDFSALENVMIPMLMAGTVKSEAVVRGEHLLDQVGLKDRVSHRPRQLSGGEQQRVAVARALANDPDLVLADEPSGNLDTGTGRALHELLLSINSEKAITFLIATHNEELARACHRRFRLSDGVLHE
jgi:lipoprotein-releasing system ATP-binding protein